MTRDPSSTLVERLAALGEIPPDSLKEARLVLHWAAQPLAAFGFSVVPARDDFSHTALQWSDEANGLRSETHEATGLYAVLDLEGFALVLRRAEQEVERFEFEGRRLDEAYAWLGEALGRAGQALEDGVTKPGHLGDMPEHAVGKGEVIVAPDPAHRRELARWFSAADALLHHVREEIPTMGPIQCWPHHFDIAMLHVLAGEGESMTSIGVGVSPGDGGYSEPYLYVTPWPYPQGELPTLPSGHWHTEGWTGAVLTGTALLGPEPSARAAAVLAMIHAAHDSSADRLREQGSKEQ